MEIQIHDNAGDSIRYRGIIKDLLFWICDELDLSAEIIDVIFTDDQSLKELHRDFLNDDTFTDVMTFNLSDSPSIDSEIYISIDRARENAEKYNVSYQNEIMRLLIHACLHLSGYDDTEERKRKKMKEQEDYYLHQAEKRFENFSSPT